MASSNESPPPKKRKSLEANNEQNTNHLISLEDIEPIFEKFKKCYTEAKDVVKLRMLPYTHLYNQLQSTVEACKKDQQKIVVALFGPPGQGKSTFINCLITGSFTTPLPSSGQTGSGCTQKPIRCTFTSKTRYRVWSIKDKRNHTRDSTDDFNDLIDVVNEKTFDLKDVVKMSEYINIQMKIAECEEIQIEVPLDVVQNSIISNIEFLDLVGPENLLDEAGNSGNTENQTTKLNRAAVERKTIDLVFLLPNQRAICNVEIIRQLWSIGIFSNLATRRPPKLVVSKLCNITDSTGKDISDMLEGFKNEKCAHNLKYSIIHKEGFDFYIHNQEFKQNAHQDASERQQHKIRMSLDIEQKSVLVPEIYQRSDAFCFLVRKSCSKGSLLELIDADFQGYNSKARLLNIIDDVRKYKSDQMLRDILLECLMVSVELNAKTNAKLCTFRRSQSNKNSIYEKAFKYLYSKANHSPYKRLIERTKEKIHSIFETKLDYLLDVNMIEDYEIDDSREEIISRRYYIIQDIFKDLVKSLANECTHAYDEIKKHISNDNTNQDFIELMHPTARCFNKDHFMRRLNNDLKKLRTVFTQKDNEEEAERKLRVEIENSETKVFALIDDLKGSILDESSDFIGKLDSIENLLNSLRDVNDKILEYFQSQAVDEPNDFILDMPEPRRFFVSNALKMPKKDEIKEIKSVDDIFMKRWLQKDTKVAADTKAKTMLMSGKVKSNIKIEHRPITKEFADELRGYGIHFGIQVSIDRTKRKVIAEYDKKMIDSRLTDLLKSVSESSSSKIALNPIFISSKTRVNGFEPNLLIKDLCNGTNTSPFQSFLIFLCINAGSPGSRNDQEIKLYTNKVKKQLQLVSQSNELSPFVFVFLPDANLGVGREKTIMMLLAEHFSTNKFYIINDDIFDFNEFDRRAHVRETRSNEKVVARALYFMDKVLTAGMSNADIDPDDNENIADEIKEEVRTKWLKLMIKKEDDVKEECKEYYNSLLNIIDGREFDKKELIKFLLEKIEPKIEIFEEIKNSILSFNSRILGEIALWNQNDYHQSRSLRPRLLSSSKSTHFISKVRDQCVLYNLDAIKGIHPVSDEGFFKPILSKELITRLCEKVRRPNFKGEEYYEAAISGYANSEKFYTYYQALNGVTGYVVYYFSITDMDS